MSDKHEELIAYIDQARDGHNVLAQVVDILVREVNLLSGRVEIQMRLLARIIAKMDPAFTESEHDPEVRRRSNLLTNSVIDRIKAEALAQASINAEDFARLQRYFANIKPLSED